MKLQKEHSLIDQDNYLCCIYIPPKNSNRHALNDENIFDVLYDDILKYNDSGYCIIYGDLNSRCGVLHDYVNNIVYSEDINNIVSSDAVNEDNIRSRLSDDSIVNEYGRTLILLICALLMIY